MENIQLNNSILGYTNGMPTMQTARIIKFLEQKLNYSGVVMSRKQFILNKLIEGCYPLKTEYSSYNPEIIYKLKTNDGYYTIKKTEYDFAEYVYYTIGLHNIQNYLDKENLENEKIKEQEQQEKQQKEQEKREQEQKEFEYSNWLENEITNYNDQNKIEILNAIYLDGVGNTGPIKLLVLIDNINKIECRNDLLSWLHIGNKTSKKVFHYITGVKLANTNKECRIQLENINLSDYVGVIPYKSKGQKDKYLYYISTHNQGFLQTYGDMVICKGLIFFINNNSITEARTGANIGYCYSKDYETEIHNLLEQRGNDNFLESLERHKEIYGESPFFTTDDGKVELENLIEKYNQVKDKTDEEPALYTYYIITNDGYTEKTTKIKPYKYKGFTLYIAEHENNNSKGKFQATESRSGLRVATECKNIKECKAKICANIEEKLKALETNINNIITKYGENPLYKREAECE